MNLVFIAPPQAGKGTFSTLLNEKYGFVCISMGQLLRDVDPESELGKKIRELQAERKLVDNETVTQLLKERLLKPDCEKGFILDGFPREIGQVSILENLSKELNFNIDAVVYLSIPYEVALDRTLSRRCCPNCKRGYNVKGFPKPKNEGLCDFCNVELAIRQDDTEEALKKGFDVFNNLTKPTFDYYKEHGYKTIEIDSNRAADVTFKELEEKLGLNND